MEPVSRNSQISPSSGAGQGSLVAGAAPMSPLGSGASLAATPQAAQDSDLIEDEWVAAVKNVLHTYHNDPYSLADALSSLRQNYLLKRYGRNLKASD